MRKGTKITLIIALCFLALGLVFYAVAIGVTGRFNYNPIELDPTGAVTRTEVITESFRNIRVEDVECNIRLLPAEDGNVSVVCTDTSMYKHQILVRNDTLIITAEECGTFWDHLFQVSAGEQELTVFLPFPELDHLHLETVSGDVRISNDFSVLSLYAGSVSGNVELTCPVLDDLTVETVSGNIRLLEIAPQSLTCSTTSGITILEHTDTSELHIETVSGEVTLTDVTVSEFTDLSAVSGSIRLNNMDCGDLIAETVSGSITGTVPTVKCFETETVSGSIYISEHHSDAPLWSLSTTSGDIHIVIEHP